MHKLSQDDEEEAQMSCFNASHDQTLARFGSLGDGNSCKHSL